MFGYSKLRIYHGWLSAIIFDAPPLSTSGTPANFLTTHQSCITQYIQLKPLPRYLLRTLTPERSFGQGIMCSTKGR